MPPPGITRIRDAAPPADAGLFPEVDEGACVIRRVKLCGIKGRNAGRRYPPDVLARAVRLYEGCPINVSHLKPGETQRGFPDRLGWVSNARAEPDGLYGDLHYNPENGHAKALVWWAKKNPRAIGLSHDAFVRKVHDPEGELVTEILQVIGVDLVADGSTTSGLTEAYEMDPTLTAGPEDEGYEAQVGALVKSIVTDATMSMADKRKKILAALKLLDDAGGDEAAETPVDDEAADESAEEEAVKTATLEKMFADLGKTIVDSNAALVAQVTEAMKRPKGAATTSVAREAVEVPTGPKKPTAAPSVKDLIASVRADGDW